MAIYTRTGDSGETSLFGGKRVLKCHELVDVYGSMDELNSWIGLVSAQIQSSDVQHFLAAIQGDLFAIGGHIAGWKTDLSGLDDRVAAMEARIDALEEKLPKLNNFILPGGAPLAAMVHLARAIARRVERQTVALAQQQKVDPRMLKYLNRLSDLLFMLARFINSEAGVVEAVWFGIKGNPTNKNHL